MTEAGSVVRSFVASDGYPLHVAIWPAGGQHARTGRGLARGSKPRGLVSRLGRSLAAAGYTASFPDRRGSGANARDRGHARSARRLNLDLAEWLRAVRTRASRAADRAGRHQLGRKTRGDRRRPASRAGRCGRLDLSWASSPSRRLARGATADRLGVSHQSAEDVSRFRSRTQRSSPPIRQGQAFIAADPYSLRKGTAGLDGRQLHHRPAGCAGTRVASISRRC